ncbi:MAG: hypothetical protein JWP22_3247 [Ramlibacter sp.]|nr:hypothetical protein [Ramlibacter sp.]MDB5914572.1 hypothetical protein [Ramlibacter sp.]
MNSIIPALPGAEEAGERQRTALREGEAAHEHWRLVQAALAAAEIRLWTEALRGADAETCRQLGAETQKLREAARAARHASLQLLAHKRA